MDLYRWAARHDALISESLAIESGVTRRHLQGEIAAGRLDRIRPGVLAVRGAPPTWRQQVRAVLLASTVGAAGSCQTALRLLGGSDEYDDEWIHVCTSLEQQVRFEGVVVHRTGLLLPEDLTTRAGIPCTAPLRTVIDLSGPLDAKELGRVVDDFLRRRLIDLNELRGRVAVVRSAPGRSPKTLRLVLAARIPGYDPGESELEGRLRRIIDRHGFPTPAQQHRVEYGGSRYRIDFAWPDHRIFVEGNGFGFHRLSSDLDGHARRQNLLVIEGWRPIELTWRMTEDEIVDTLGAVLPRRR